MEETNKTKGKKSVAQETKTEQKYTYEQLNDICNQLFQQNQNLARQVQQMNQTNMFKRLDYLFKVLELEKTIKDADFVNSCIDEIKDAMTIPAEEESKND